MTTMTASPLEQIRRETKTAHRAPHLRKKNITPTDQIDALDNITGTAYHHDGPYDATLAARNRDPKYAPVEATKVGNMEALKATPYENLQDSLRRHVPLSGTAIIPPGEEDLAGRTMQYEEGADLMREDDAAGGAYRRWKDYDYQYHPDDLKGKAEPTYTIDRQLKGHNRRSYDVESNEAGVYEMSSDANYTHSRSSSKGDNNVTVRQRSSSSAGPSSAIAGGSSVNRSNTTGRRMEGLKRRIGSLRRKSPES